MDAKETSTNGKSKGTVKATTVTGGTTTGPPMRTLQRREAGRPGKGSPLCSFGV